MVEEQDESQEAGGAKALKAGTVGLIGRPNAGKSTLMNRWLEEKVSIVSDKPQTTRNRMVGIHSDSQRGQIVFHDTPGVHKPLHRLNRQMLRQALDALNESDVICVLVDASKRYGGGDAHLLRLVEKTERPRLLLLNKIDRVAKSKLLPMIENYAASRGADGNPTFEAIVPISALTGDGTQEVLDMVWDRLPVGEPLHDPELLTTHPERFLVAERIREKVLDQTRDELPYTTAVVLDKWVEDEESSRLRLYATILVDKPGQKAIVIGRGGSRIKEIGTAARLDLMEFLERPLHLELNVRHEPGWRENRRVLGELDREVDYNLGDFE